MHEAILKFWFEEIPESAWWTKDPEFDDLIRQRFGDLHQQATANELFSWRDSPQGSLAEIIILDQFSRNIYRDKPESFAFDAQAVALTQAANVKGFDSQLPNVQRKFLYMPLMHSESLLIHEKAVELFATLGDVNTYNFELQHQAIVEKFGRYPHRNQILGRISTPQELEFLSQPNSGF